MNTLLILVGEVLSLVVIIALLPSGIRVINSIRDAQNKVAQLEESDAPAGVVFKRAGRSGLVILTLLVFIGIMVILPLIITSANGIGTFVATTFNSLLRLLGISYQFPIPGAYLIHPSMFI